MNSLFDLDNPVMIFMSTIGDLLLVNILFLFCCIPVFTIGAAWTAMCKVTQEIAAKQYPSVVRTFFRSFKENFKHSTIVWIFEVIILASLIMSFLFLHQESNQELANIAKFALGVVAILTVAISVHIYPQIAHYENRLKIHLKNAALLSVAKLPKTMLLAILKAAPIVLLLLTGTSVGGLQFLDVCTLLGFSIFNYLSSVLMKRIFSEMERPNE